MSTENYSEANEKEEQTQPKPDTQWTTPRKRDIPEDGWVEVQVRNYDNQEWQYARLKVISPATEFPYVVIDEKHPTKKGVDKWKQCRIRPELTLEMRLANGIFPIEEKEKKKVQQLMTKKKLKEDTSAKMKEETAEETTSQEEKKKLEEDTVRTLQKGIEEFEKQVRENIKKEEQEIGATSMTESFDDFLERQRREMKTYLGPDDLTETCKEHEDYWMRVADEETPKITKGDEYHPDQEYNTPKAKTTQTYKKEHTNTPKKVVTAIKSDTMPKTRLSNTGVSQIPGTALIRIGNIFKEGEQVYGKDNWKKGIFNKEFQQERLEHAYIHLLRYLDGDRTEDHLAKIAWWAVTQMWMEFKEGEIMSLGGLPPSKGPDSGNKENYEQE